MEVVPSFKISKFPNRGTTFIVLIATALVVIWFRKGMIMATGESGIPFYNPSHYYEVASTAWYGQLGTYSYTTVAGRYFYFLIGLLQSVGIPKFLTQALVFWALLIIQGISIYKIVDLVSKGSGRMAATSSALFFMLNPYAMAIWGRFDYTLLLLYASIPPSLYLFMRGLEGRRAKYAIYLALTSFGFSYAFSTVTQLFTFWLVPFTYFIYHILTNRNKKDVMFGFCFLLISLALFIAVNLWWITQLFTVKLTYVGALASFDPGVNLGILYGISKELGLMQNVIRLVSPATIYTLEVPRGYIYSTGIFELISFLPPVICFSALLFRRNFNRLFIYFALIALLGLFLSKGVAGPFGGIFEYVFVNFTLFQVYRNPFEKLTVIATLGYTVLFGVGLSSLTERIKMNVQTSGVKPLKSPILTATLICFLVSGVYVWPMWTGTLFTSGQYPQNNPEVGYCVKVPESYRELNIWLKQRDKEDHGLLILPLTGVGITYDWKYGYSGTVPGVELFDEPSIPSYVSEDIPHLNKITHAIDNALLKTSEFWKMLALMNIKYVIVSWDRNCTARPDTLPPSLISKALNSAKYINYATSFGKLDVYELQDDHLPGGIVYATNLLVTPRDSDEFITTLEDESFIPGKVVAFLRSQSDTNDVEFLSSLELDKEYCPELVYKRLNPARYVISIKNATEPFFLVLSQTYHSQWKSFANGEEIPAKYHFVVNGYANAWYIDRYGSYTITIEFYPQRYLELGSSITIVGLVMCLIDAMYIHRDSLTRLFLNRPKLMLRKKKVN